MENKEKYLKELSYNLITELLKNTILNVEFKKANGEIRKMECTLNPQILKFDAEYQKFLESVSQKDESSNVKEPTYESVRVWDLEKNAWRSFRLDRLLNFKVKRG